MVVSVGNGILVCSMLLLFLAFIGAECAFFNRNDHRWKKTLREKGNLNRAPLNRKSRKLDVEWLKRYVGAHPDAYLKELAKLFAVNVGCIFKVLKKLKITLKKRREPTGSGTKRNVESMKRSYLRIKKKT
jgi:hypothetical protein